MKNSKLLILDACSLLNRKPISLARKAAAKSGAVLIVPQKVREELYGLLKGKRNRYAVMHAQQLISRNKWGVLPHHGMFRDGDEEILSYCSMHVDAPLQVYTRDKRLAKRIAERCPRVQVVR